MPNRTPEQILKWKESVPKGRCLNDGKTHFKKGRIPWNKGMSMTEETKLKISKSKKENPTKHWQGKNRSSETKQKISEKRKGIPAWNKGIHQPQTAGENNPNWKGGTSRGYREGYYSLEYKQWRTAVFERDNYTCQECGQEGGYLTAHHIKSFAHYPDLRFELSNGKTLCEDCHEKTDNYKGRGRIKNKAA